MNAAVDITATTRRRGQVIINKAAAVDITASMGTMDITRRKDWVIINKAAAVIKAIYPANSPPERRP